MVILMNDASAEDEDDDVCGGADGILDAIGGEVQCDPVSGFTWIYALSTLQSQL